MLNYLAAPIGTTEALLLQYGIEGPDFTRDANGNPVPTQQGLVDTIVPWKNISGPPDSPVRRRPARSTCRSPIKLRRSKGR